MCNAFWTSFAQKDFDSLQRLEGFLVLATLGRSGISIGMTRRLRVEHPGAIYHPPSLEATAGQV